MTFDCPVCGHHYQVPDDLNGSFVEACGITFVCENGEVRFLTELHPEPQKNLADRLKEELDRT